VKELGGALEKEVDIIVSMDPAGYCIHCQELHLEYRDHPERCVVNKADKLLRKEAEDGTISG
jgi:hypothetical protein